MRIPTSLKITPTYGSLKPMLPTEAGSWMRILRKISSNKGFYENYIQDRGHMGKAFKNYYKGSLKMGDTPSLAYVMNGNPEDPLGESWGGSFTQINHSSRVIFDRQYHNI